MPLSEKRIGELLEAKGDIDAALSHYSRFVDLWKNAEPSLQPQVRKVRDRMRELQRRKG